MLVKFMTTIRTKGLDILAKFLFDTSLKAFKNNKSFRFILQEINPCFSTIIINKGNEVPFVSIRCWIDWSTNV
jgi:hypothetical protein